MVTPIEWIALAAVVASTTMAIASAVRQGKMAQQQAEFAAKQAAAQNEQQARFSDRNVQLAAQEQEAEAQRLAFDLETQRKAISRRTAERRAMLGAAGLDPSGSPLLVAIDEAREAELSLEALKYQSGLRQQQLTDEAALQRFQAEEFRQAGSTALGIGRYQTRVARQEATWAAIGAGVQGASSAVGAYSTGVGGRTGTSGTSPRASSGALGGTGGVSPGRGGSGYLSQPRSTLLG